MGAFDDQIDDKMQADNRQLTEWLASRLHPVETMLAVARAGDVASVSYRTFYIGLTPMRAIVQYTDARGELVGAPCSVRPGDIADTPVWHSGRTRRALLSGIENQMRVALRNGRPYRFVILNGVSFEENMAPEPQLAVLWSFLDWLSAAQQHSMEPRPFGLAG